MNPTICPNYDSTDCSTLNDQFLPAFLTSVDWIQLHSTEVPENTVSFDSLYLEAYAQGTLNEDSVLEVKPYSQQSNTAYTPIDVAFNIEV